MRLCLTALATCCCLLSLTACPSKGNQPDPIQTPKAPEVTRRPDEPALMQLEPRGSHFKTLPQPQARVSAIARDADYTYLLVPDRLWDEVGGQSFAPGFAPEHAIVTGLPAGRHAVVMPALDVLPPAHGDANALKAHQLILRITGADPLDAPLQLTLAARTISVLLPLRYHHAQSTSPDALAITQDLLLDADVPVTPTLIPKFYQGAARWFKSRDSLPFYSYAASRLQQRIAPSAEAPNNLIVQRPGLQGDLLPLMDLYSGATSTREALQTDRALLTRDAPQERTIPLTELTPPALASHPWDAMIAKLKRTPRVEPTASVIPHDMIYLYFQDLRELVALAADLDNLLSPALRALEGSGADAFMVARYERQLIIERTVLSKTLGHVAAKGVALVSSDPFLREGNDVSLVFHVNNRATLTSALDAFILKAKSAHPDLTQSDVTIGGVTARLARTPDGRLQRYQLELGEHLILTNSADAAARFVSAHQGTTPSLARSGDFRMMRAIYPYDAPKATGFLFLGDALVARIISPKLKIAQARRMAAQADLAAVAHAAMLFRIMEGRAPQDTASLIERGWLPPHGDKHADGTPITYAPMLGPRSDAWGGLDHLTPLIGVEVDSVTEQERDAYTRFERGYRDNWTQLIDPIGVQLTREANGAHLSLDGRMLPLIEGSEYNSLIQLVGQRVMRPGAPTGGLEWTFAIGDDASLRREVARAMQKSFGEATLNLSWLGDFITVGARDKSALWDLALLAHRSLRMGSTYDNEDPRLEPLALLTRAPVYVMIHITNPVVLAATIARIKQRSDEFASGLVRWAPGELYREIATVTLSEEVAQSGRQGQPPFTLHYAIANQRLIFALRRDVLEDQLDALLDGRAAEPAPQDDQTRGPLPLIDSDDTQTSITLAPWRTDSWMRKTLTAMLATIAQQDALNSLALTDLLWRAGIDGSLTDAQRRDLSLRHLGVAPADLTPHTLKRDPTTGAHVHPLFGSVIAPRQPYSLDTLPLGALLDATQRLVMSLSFEGEGEFRGLHSRVRWERDQ